MEGKQIDSSNYFLLCIDNRITQLFKDTCLGIQYWRQHRHVKCYKCRQYGHLAKQCKDICIRCHNYHPSLPVCIYYMERLLEEIIELLNHNKNTPYQKYISLKKKIEKFAEDQDEKYIKKQVENTLKSEVANKEVQHVDDILIPSVNYERQLEYVKNTVDSLYYEGKEIRVHTTKFTNLIPSPKSEIGFIYDEYKANWYTSWLYTPGTCQIINKSVDMASSLSIRSNQYMNYVKINNNPDYKDKVISKVNNDSIGRWQKKRNISKRKTDINNQSKQEHANGVTLRVKEVKLIDKNYYVNTPKHKQELIESIIKSEDIYNKEKLAKMRKLKEKKLYKIEEKFNELQSYINKDKEVNKLLKQIEALKYKRERLKDDCRNMQEQKHNITQNLTKAKQIGASIIKNAKHKAEVVKDNAYEHYNNRALRRKYAKQKQEHKYDLGTIENERYWEDREEEERKQLEEENNEGDECDTNLE